jgi:hypothetical protein
MQNIKIDHEISTHTRAKAASRAADNYSKQTTHHGELRFTVIQPQNARVHVSE